jgi:hypothetical protein
MLKIPRVAEQLLACQEELSSMDLVNEMWSVVCVRGGPNQPLHRDPQWSIVLMWSVDVRTLPRSKASTKTYERNNNNKGKVFLLLN